MRCPVVGLNGNLSPQARFLPPSPYFQGTRRSGGEIVCFAWGSPAAEGKRSGLSGLFPRIFRWGRGRGVCIIAGKQYAAHFVFPPPECLHRTRALYVSFA